MKTPCRSDLTKTCSACGETKPLTDFYVHPNGLHGRLHRCRECHKQATRQNYRQNRDQFREYERRRQQDTIRRAAKSEYQKRHRDRHPDRYQARTKVGNAIRDGRIDRPRTCDRCGENRSVQAHHPNHDHALSVEWLCIECHRIADGTSVKVNP